MLISGCIVDHGNINMHIYVHIPKLQWSNYLKMELEIIFKKKHLLEKIEPTLLIRRNEGLMTLFICHVMSKLNYFCVNSHEMYCNVGWTTVFFNRFHKL